MSKREKTAKKSAEQKQPRGATAPSPALSGVNLLPKEYYAERKERRSLRLLALGVVGVLLIGVAGSVAAAMLAQTANAELAAEQQRGANLRAERAQFGELTEVLSELSAASGAQAIALYAEVDWSRVSREFNSSLPDENTTTLSLNLGQRLAPAVSSRGRADTSDANPLSGLSPILVEYQIESTSENAGERLLDRLVDRMTGYEWATQIAAKQDDDGVFTFSGFIRLNMEAIGTDRAERVEEGELAALRDSFAQASIDETASARGVR